MDDATTTIAAAAIAAAFGDRDIAALLRAGRARAYSPDHPATDVVDGAWLVAWDDADGVPRSRAYAATPATTRGAILAARATLRDRGPRWG